VFFIVFVILDLKLYFTWEGNICYFNLFNFIFLIFYFHGDGGNLIILNYFIKFYF
jgi:hypothetical protein